MREVLYFIKIKARKEKVWLQSKMLFTKFVVQDTFFINIFKTWSHLFTWGTRHHPSQTCEKQLRFDQVFSPLFPEEEICLDWNMFTWYRIHILHYFAFHDCTILLWWRRISYVCNILHLMITTWSHFCNGLMITTMMTFSQCFDDHNDGDLHAEADDIILLGRAA